MIHFHFLLKLYGFLGLMQNKTVSPQRLEIGKVAESLYVLIGTFPVDLVHSVTLCLAWNS